MLPLNAGFVGVSETERPGEPGKGAAVLDIDKFDTDKFRLLVDKFKLLLSLKTCVLALLPEGVACRYRRCPVPQLGDPERARCTAPTPRAEDTPC
mmetsp:Transcript_67979/g.107807  ORF Transcript_67979/g.107807 Transcript_67979/m.107807 type:complete len:95 (-) Transcript_67979:1518-1802(-)